MKEKYQIIVDMYESHDAEGYYAWRIEDSNGYEVRKGLARTPIIGFAEAIQKHDELKNE